MSLAQINPFDYFSDTNGDPLDQGYIYVGAANQDPETNPISIYYDAEMTIPAPQPLRTVAGYISNPIAPQTFFTNENYSVSVRDKNQIVLFYVANFSSIVSNTPFALQLSASNAWIAAFQAYTQAWGDNFIATNDAWSANYMATNEAWAAAFQANLIQRYLSFNNRGNWATGTGYAIQDLVIQGSIAYICLIAHTSGVFATDLANGDWAIYQGATKSELGASTGAALIGFIQAGVGAVLRTSQDKMRERFSVADNGALPSASAATNNAAVQQIIDNFNVGAVARGAFSYNVAGDYNQSSEILIHRKTLAIDGNHASVKWGGNNSTSIFRVTDSARVSFKNLVLLGDITNPPFAAINFDVPETGTTGSNENHTVENVCIGRKYTSDTTTGGSSDETPYAKVQHGIYVGGVVNGNNDEYVFNNVQVHSASIAAIAFNRSQSIWSSLNNILVNDSEIGLLTNCNLMLNNFNSNRCRNADISSAQNTESWVTCMNAENSNIFIKSAGGASFFVKGGELQRNSVTPSNFFRVENGGSLVLDSLFVDNVQVAADTIYYRAGSSKTGILRVRNCTIKNGSLRSTWDVDTGGAGGAQVDIDIEHKLFRFKTSKPYLDRLLTLASVNTAVSVSGTASGANTPLGKFFQVAYAGSLQVQHLTSCPNAANAINLRLFNVSGGAIQLAADRFRWMNLGDYIDSSASASIAPTSMLNNTGFTGTVAIAGAQLGDFITWGAMSAFVTANVTAYVSSPNTVSVRIHNGSGGTHAPAATTFTVAKLKEFGNFRNTLSYTPAQIANAETVTLTVSVVGAQLGGHTFVSYSADLAGVTCTSYVSAADTVTIVLTNYTGAGVTLAAGYFKVMVAF